MGGELPALPDAAVQAALDRMERLADATDEQIAVVLEREDWGRGVARSVLDAARDPALGPDRLVLGRELDEWIAHCAAACEAKDQALTAVERLAADRQVVLQSEEARRGR